MLLLAQLMAEAGLPDGVLSVLPTSKSGEVTGPLIDDPRLRKLTFTGSTGVGKMLVEKSAKRLLRTSMELGGNAPFVVFDDADVDKAVEGAVLAKLRNGGEACTAANRFHVANAVREEFTTKLTEKMAAFTMGPGTDPETKLGPLIDLRSRIGMVLQDAWLFGGTIRENIAYGKPGATDEEIRRAAEMSYVDKFVHSLPEGYDTVIDEEGSNVSAGEKQLITIARAFISQPSILIDQHRIRSPRYQSDIRTHILEHRPTWAEIHTMPRPAASPGILGHD